MTQALDANLDEGSAAGEVSLRVVFGSHRVVDDETLRLAVFLVDNMGLLVTIDGWKAAERRGPGGRPATFSFRALLVGMVVCVLTDQRLELTQVCDVMFRQMSPHWREVLGIPDPPAEDDQRGWLATYRTSAPDSTTSSPSWTHVPPPKNTRLDHATFVARTEEIRSQRSEDEWIERDERLGWVINRILEASLRLLRRDPADMEGHRRRGCHPGPLLRPSREAHRVGRWKQGSREVAVHSADPDAAYYVRDPDARDDGQPTSARKIAWGREATLVVSAPDDPDDPNFPSLVIGMAPLHKPGTRSEPMESGH